MAAIDDKMHALQFEASTSKSLEQITRIVTDAAELAGAAGGKVAITQSGPGEFSGAVRNFFRVTHGVFSVSATDASHGESRVLNFTICDYVRVRETVLGFIPVSPWSAPAYKAIRTFSEYLRSKL